MKSFSRLFLLCLGMVLSYSPVHAQRRPASPPGSVADLATPPPEPPPLPPVAAPRINPAAPPSVSLQPFLDRHLGQILAPLGQRAFTQSEVISSLQAGYTDGLAAAPPAHKPAYQAAQGVCDALTSAMAERQNAVTALRGAFATRSSEADQPRGGGEAVAAAHAKDDFFASGQKNTWIERTEVLRKNINALYLNEREIERQIGPWSGSAPAATVPPPAAPTSAPVVAAATPSVSAPAPDASKGQPEGQDPVVGNWMWPNQLSVALGADHSITATNGGTWKCVSTGPEGRSYKFQFTRPPWVHSLVLSSDGKTLAGKNLRGEHIVATRQ